MRKITPVVLLLLILLVACKSKSNVVTTKSKPYKTTRPVTRSKTSKKVTVKPKTTNDVTNEDTTEDNENSELVYGTSTADNIIKKALSYKGTKYRYGGVTKKGIDCSGLMHVSYKSQNIILPRSSYEQSKKGVKIPLSKAQKGDLLFFKTSRNRISHVGLIIEVDDEDIRFIHASTSRGVIISSLKEGYWNNAFVEARTIL